MYEVSSCAYCRELLLPNGIMNVHSMRLNPCSMDFQQTYIPHEYIELRMPPLASGSSDHAPRYRLDPHGLHIWPRHSLMLIALPNKVESHPYRTLGFFVPNANYNRTDRLLALYLRHGPNLPVFRTAAASRHGSRTTFQRCWGTSTWRISSKTSLIIPEVL